MGRGGGPLQPTTRTVFWRRIELQAAALLYPFHVCKSTAVTRCMSLGFHRLPLPWLLWVYTRAVHGMQSHHGAQGQQSCVELHTCDPQRGKGTLITTS